MSGVADRVLTTVNAPYATALTAQQLARCISGGKITKESLGPTFSFFTEVAPRTQKRFVEEMKLDPKAVAAVARDFSAKAGYRLALAAQA